MMDCLCVVRVNINVIGQRVTNLNSCGFCGGTGVVPTETRKRVSYIMMMPPSEAPVVCVPTTLPIIYKEGVNEPTGELYGRYRINGGDWVDYTVLADYYLVNNFLGETGVMDRQGGSQITPFQFEMGYRERLIKGASAQEPYADGQDGVISVERTTVDFQITDGGENDLVQLLFGGDASVSSCAVGSWYGT